MAQEVLRLGVCSCIADHYQTFPESTDVSFRVNGRLIVRTFSLKRIIIPEAEEMKVLLKTRAHFFLDAHYRGGVEKWWTFFELNDIRLSAPFHEEEFRCTHINRRCIKSAYYRMWDMPQPTSADEVVKAIRTLLQRLKRVRQPRGVRDWLRRMTPRKWQLPVEYT